MPSLVQYKLSFKTVIKISMYDKEIMTRVILTVWEQFPISNFSLSIPFLIFLTRVSISCWVCAILVTVLFNDNTSACNVST